MKRVDLNNLFDCYELLLTENERKYFAEYYFEDLSLSEIAINNKISRSAVGKTIKTVEHKLEDYETKLKVWNFKKTLNECLEKETLKEIKSVIERLL